MTHEEIFEIEKNTRREDKKHFLINGVALYALTKENAQIIYDKWIVEENERKRIQDERVAEIKREKDKDDAKKLAANQIIWAAFDKQAMYCNDCRFFDPECYPEDDEFYSGTFRGCKYTSDGTISANERLLDNNEAHTLCPRPKDCPTRNN